MSEMKSPLSPSDIEVLLWCHCRGEKHERFDAMAIREAISMFMGCQMIQPMENKIDVYVTTEKGNAMVRAICNTPEPHQAWVDGEGRLIPQD